MKHQPCPLAVGFCLLCSFALGDAPAKISAPAAPISQEAMKAFPYRPTAPALTALPLATPPTARPLAADETAAPAEDDLRAAPPIQMERYQVNEVPDHTYQTLNAAMARSNLLAPCALYTREVRGGKLLEAFCAPISPIPGEKGPETHQARFPLVSLAW